MKNKLSKGLSLSANPKHLIKGVFFAAQRVLAKFGVKNHTFKNNTFRTKQTDVSGLGGGLLCRCTPRNDVCSIGRSMIEMLGVLAIIAVLTVGGIAGYSKAMKKYQANKVVGEIIQVLVKWKELIEHDSGLKLYRLDDETIKTLGLCLPSAENCSRYQQRTPVGDIYIHDNVVMSDADAELCISAFNNIFIPLKGNIREFTVATVIKNWDDAYEERKECDKKCKDKCEKDRNCLDKCRDKCSEDNSPHAGICISVDKKYCGDWKYLNIDDARVMTEINAACNSGIDKRVEQIRIIFKNGFTSGY